MKNLNMSEFKTVNVKPETKKLLKKLKIEKEYKNMDELIRQEIDFPDKLE